ncbi:hypothetical protein LTR36_003246 [Oleoguttula mirabilis]|uniref:Uncharacterized protein n=1 Tax=Oleoguttula mirabilis TaxID=1507867 RepID=A0AAV9JY45_9PEZI|nr:hypothetical protein LTR36_003246 [Oleoguttula mirabilis]
MDEYQETLRKAAGEGSAYVHIPSPATPHDEESSGVTSPDGSGTTTGTARPLLRLTHPSNDATAEDTQGSQMACPIPMRTTTFAADCKTPETNDATGTSLPMPPTSTASKSRPILARNPTSQTLSKSWSSLKRTFSGGVGGSSDANLCKIPPSGLVSRDTSTPASPVSLFAHSRTNSIGDIFNFGRSRTSSGPSSPQLTVPNSPQLRSMLKPNEVPDLQSVNRALEQVKAIPGEEQGKVVFIDQLTRLAAELTGISDDAKSKLTQAMKARSDGRYEVCRGLCLEIVHSSYSEVPTKVYALNILSTQATPIQAVKYTEEASKLCKQHLKDSPEYEKILSVIAMLRESAVNKLAKHKDHIVAPQDRKKTNRKEDRGGDCSGKRGDGSEPDQQGGQMQIEDWPARGRSRNTSHDDRGLEMPLRHRDHDLTLQLPRPAISTGATTPRTEKILDWTTGVSSHADGLRVASKIGSQRDGEEESSVGSIPADGEFSLPMEGECGGLKGESGGGSTAAYVGKGKARAKD